MIPICRVCKKSDEIICYSESEAICPTCCETVDHPDGEHGHQFDYERGERDHICRYCGISRLCTEYVDVD
jgi:hypothetical protein